MLNHIHYDAGRGILRLLDQRQLPLREEYLDCDNYRQVIEAIKTLAVRGAPALGVAGAWACVLAASEARHKDGNAEFLQNALAEIRAARPTAVNLMWAVDRIASLGGSDANFIDAWKNEAEKIQKEDLEQCERIGKNGAELIKDGDAILTHCNAGALATAGYGTALGVIRAAHEAGKKIRVIADETRPLLQGARLTAYEMTSEGIPCSVAPDNACAAILAAGMVQLVITGADRIAANGDTANKIGTLGVAILANYYHVPFYIAAPLSTIDINAKNGADIPIEKRNPDEVLFFNHARTAPEKAEAINFAFDVTPASLIAGIITEKGILRPPFPSAIAQVMADK